MNELITHLEFLLHTHDCVIVPHFGGFILNVTPIRKDDETTFEAPTCELVFNQELTYNDGLLVESFMKTAGVSFEVAYDHVEAGVKELKRALQESNMLEFGNLGTLQMNEEKRYIFTPKTFVRPEFYGLTTVALQPLIHLRAVAPCPKTQKNHHTVIQKIGIGIAAAVTAAAILWISPLNKNSHIRQNAQMIGQNSLFRKNASTPVSKKNMSFSKVDPSTFAIEKPTSEKVDLSSEGNEFSTNSDQAPAFLPTKKYYVITGVFEVRQMAEKMKEMLESEGFTQAAWLERPGRIDVYAASFTDWPAAQAFLKKIRIQFPHHRDAWILEYEDR